MRRIDPIELLAAAGAMMVLGSNGFFSSWDLPIQPGDQLPYIDLRPAAPDGPGGLKPARPLHEYLSNLSPDLIRRYDLGVAPGQLYVDQSHDGHTIQMSKATTARLTVSQAPMRQAFISPLPVFQARFQAP
jgi:hypothetical protein